MDALCRSLRGSDQGPDALASLPLLLLVLALPHLLYAYVWTQHRVWKGLFGKDAVQALLVCGVAGKALQVGWVLLWAWSAQGTGLCPRRPVAFWELLAAVLLLGYGQALNAGTYRALGNVGVYYGARLGHSVPWVTAWPFSITSHPQYIGSVMSVWGALALLHSALPPSALLVAAWWSALYGATALLEHHL